MEVLSFEKAVSHSPNKRHLLLGNGFSISLKPDIFSYGSLFEAANFSKISYAQKIFDALNTRDFEEIIRVLISAAKVLKVYEGVPKALISQLEGDASELKNILVSAIAKNHPDRPFEVTPAQYASCRKFLSAFGHIYTLNYDVLLYWALMQDKVDELSLLPDDGFRHPENDPDAPYVSWLESHSPTVHYLHGALHLFDAGDEIIKYTWSKTDVPLLDQIRSALDEERYPLFVSEGTSRSKFQKIIHNAYLHKAYRSFTAICDQSASALFIFGHSLADNDDHILSRIGRGRIGQVFISLYGNPSSETNKLIFKKAEQIRELRSRVRPRSLLSIRLYDAESANVWTAKS